MITKAEAIDIVNKFDFFYGQRAGRELWSSKEYSVQEVDLVNFRQDCYDLLEYLKNTEVYNESIACS
jgi:hypothetical protein